MNTSLPKEPFAHASEAKPSETSTPAQLGSSRTNAIDREGALDRLRAAVRNERAGADATGFLRVWS